MKFKFLFLVLFSLAFVSSCKDRPDDDTIDEEVQEYILAGLAGELVAVSVYNTPLEIGYLAQNSLEPLDLDLNGDGNLDFQMTYSGTVGGGTAHHLFQIQPAPFSFSEIVAFAVPADSEHVFSYPFLEGDSIQNSMNAQLYWSAIPTLISEFTSGPQGETRLGYWPNRVHRYMGLRYQDGAHIAHAWLEMEVEDGIRVYIHRFARVIVP